MKESRGAYFGAGFIVCFVLMFALKHFFGGPPQSSERLRKLERDSVAHMEDKAAQAEKYRRIDSAYHARMARLSFQLDSVIGRRADRLRLPRSQNADSVKARILRSVGIR